MWHGKPQKVSKGIRRWLFLCHFCHFPPPSDVMFSGRGNPWLHSRFLTRPAVEAAVIGIIVVVMLLVLRLGCRQGRGDSNSRHSMLAKLYICPSSAKDSKIAIRSFVLECTIDSFDHLFGLRLVCPGVFHRFCAGSFC